MSSKCETQACKNRLTAGITAGLVILTIAMTELILVAQVHTPFLSAPAPF